MNTTIDYYSIGLRLKEVRETTESKKISQDAFGKQFGVSQGYVTKIEKGGKPSLEYLLDIAKHYEVSLDWLLLGRESDKYQVDSEFNKLFDMINEVIQISPYFEEWIKLLITVPKEAQPLLIGTVRTLVQSSYPAASGNSKKNQPTSSNTEDEIGAAAEIA